MLYHAILQLNKEAKSKTVTQKTKKSTKQTKKKNINTSASILKSKVHGTSQKQSLFNKQNTTMRRNEFKKMISK